MDGCTWPGPNCWRDRRSRPNCGPSCPAAAPLPTRSCTPASTWRVYQNDPQIVLFRPERILPGTQLGARAIDLEVAQLPDADEYFRNLPLPGSLFFIRRRKYACLRSIA